MKKEVNISNRAIGPVASVSYKGMEGAPNAYAQPTYFTMRYAPKCETPYNILL